VFLLNGSIVVYGLYLARGTRTGVDWFLGGRSLPWWMVGLSMYATAIDSSDLIADSGGSYTLGISYFVVNWVGIVGGWALAAFVICLPMYRAGMYTNAEYLEARFGVVPRVVSVLVQVQYRTLVLAIMGTTIYLVMSIVTDFSPAGSWSVVVAIAVLAAAYTAFGGLRSVAVTDNLQFILMAASALIIWGVVWNHVGGWSGIEAKLAAADPDLPQQMLHVGHDNVEVIDVSEQTGEGIDRFLLTGGDLDESKSRIVRRTPGWLVALSMVIVGMAYALVNHTQAMRMFGARSEWDFKMAVSLAGVAMLVFTFINLSMGIMGRALYPDQAVLPDGNQDTIYPILLRDFGPGGLKGILVAGVLAASLSTYDSIGSTLSALITRDIYARLLVRDRDDHHYLRVGQWLTPVIIAVSFLYVPFLLKGGMVLFYLDLTSAFVVPLLTLYFMGVLTPVHRRSGFTGLLVGGAYGVLRLLGPKITLATGVPILPAFLLNTYAAYAYSMVFTAGAMIIHSGVAGWEKLGELRHEESGVWLRASQIEAQNIEREHEAGAERSNGLPGVLAALMVAIGLVLSFVVFW
jgi:SSS family solute:Na+ symporter